MKRQKAGIKQKGILGNVNTKSHSNCPVTCTRNIKSLDLFLFVALKRESSNALFKKHDCFQKYHPFQCISSLPLDM